MSGQHMDGQCSRKVALVTGGGRGIGAAVASALAQRGYDLVLTYAHRAADAQCVAESLGDFGATVTLHCADAADRVAMKSVIEQTWARFGRIDAVVNNAGMLQQKAFETITDDDWARMLDVNVKSVFICAQEVMPFFSRQGAGAMVNVASSGGQLGGTLAVHYAASKAAVISLTKSLARIGAAHNVRVNCVSPGLIETQMTAAEIASEAGQDKIANHIPVKRQGRPQEVAAAIAYLLSDDATYITGQTINVNGGLYMG